MLLFDPATIQPAAARRVRCRPIAEDDFHPLVNLLARGFARTKRDYWIRGLSRWRTLPLVEGMPRYGYVLDGGMGLVGAILLLSSVRDGRILTSLSGWYVEPAWRAHAPLLIAVATRLKQATYVAASASPQSWRILQAQGFKPYNFGRSTVFPFPGKGKVSDIVPAQMPEARLLHDHRQMDAVSLTVDRDGQLSPFVFRPCRLGTPSVKMMELVYCRDSDDFKRCAPALARHFYRQGVMGFLVDGRVTGMPSRYHEGQELRYYRGLQPPVLNDLAYTRKTVFG